MQPKYKNNLTREYLDSILDYNPDTGEFRWKISPRANVKEGDIAGTRHPRGYIRIFIKRTAYMAHILAWFIMTGHWPKHRIDHRDKNPGNNKWINLRKCTHSQNIINSKIREDNKSGCTGVIWSKFHKKWFAYITVNKIRKNLGYYEDLNDAIKARKEAELKYFGDFLAS